MESSAPHKSSKSIQIYLQEIRSKSYFDMRTYTVQGPVRSIISIHRLDNLRGWVGETILTVRKTFFGDYLLQHNKHDHTVLLADSFPSGLEQASIQYDQSTSSNYQQQHLCGGPAVNVTLKPHLLCCCIRASNRSSHK